MAHLKQTTDKQHIKFNIHKKMRLTHWTFYNRWHEK